MVQITMPHQNDPIPEPLSQLIVPISRCQLGPSNEGAVDKQFAHFFYHVHRTSLGELIRKKNYTERVPFTEKILVE